MQVKRIHVTPLKSLSMFSCEHARFSPTGHLTGDRVIRLLEGGDPHKILNGKWADRHDVTAFFGIRAEVVDIVDDVFHWEASLWYQVQQTAFYPLGGSLRPFEEFLSDVLKRHVVCDRVSTPDESFPDDRKRPGPTVISNGTLELLAKELNLSYDSVQLRLRPTLVIEGSAFSEFDLVGKQFAIEGNLLEGNKPCVRCGHPTRDPWTGEKYSEFRERLGAIVRPWLDCYFGAAQYGTTGYFCAINTTVITTVPTDIAVGSALVILA